MKSLFRQPYFFTFLISLSILFLVVCSYIFGWTIPTDTPPNENLLPPLNTSNSNQYKLGYLGIGTTTSPSFPLDVAGIVRIGRFSSAPTGALGSLYYDTTSNKFKGYTNIGWSNLGGAELWSQSGNNIYYNTGKVGIGTSTISYTLTVDAGSGSGNEIRICKGGVCCPIWKDCDGDSYTYGNGDCDESNVNINVGANYTLIYLTTQTYNGNLGGRSGADSKCSSDIPSNLPTNCATSTIHSFISVNANDEIQDMPTVYGYASSKPLKWFNRSTGAITTFANSWADALDNSISATDTTGTGVTGNRWSGSAYTGALASYHCTNWTTTSGSGQYGVSNSTTGTYLNSSYIACTNTYYLRCAISCGCL